MPRSSKKKLPTRSERLVAAIKKPFTAIKNYSVGLMKRRPHRSFKLTKRRDYRRSLKLPGYISFTKTVTKTLWQHRRIFIWLAAVYALMTIVLVGIGSQETYSTLIATIQDAGAEVFQGNMSELGTAALAFFSIGASGLIGTPTEAQQLYILVLGLLVWLTTVWLLRNVLAGHKVKMRDGLYNAGAPIVATLLVFVVMVIQLIPLGIAIVGYSTAASTGLLNGGVEAMLFWVAAALLTVMSLYWITSTFFALIIVTLPGMYPRAALKTAGDMMVGRRLRILLRLAWMAGALAVTGAVVLIPIILLTNLLTGVWSVVGTIPIVPVALMIYSVAGFIWAASYIYLLYRKVIDDDAKPA